LQQSPSWYKLGVGTSALNKALRRYPRNDKLKHTVSNGTEIPDYSAEGENMELSTCSAGTRRRNTIKIQNNKYLKYETEINKKGTDKKADRLTTGGISATIAIMSQMTLLRDGNASIDQKISDGKTLPSHLSPENLSYSTHPSTLTAQAKKANEHGEK
jgi:hypothetical protein